MAIQKHIGKIMYIFNQCQLTKRALIAEEKISSLRANASSLQQMEGQIHTCCTRLRSKYFCAYIFHAVLRSDLTE